MSKTYVMGDVHGAYRALVQVLERSNFNKEEDTLIFLGDVCDGWNEVYECVEELLTIKNLISILGNHDKVFLDWINSATHGWGWLQGAKATADSYIRYAERECVIYAGKGGYLTNLTMLDMPLKHIQFYQNMLFKYTDHRNRCFVHGGFNRHYLIDDQTIDVLCWDRDLWMAALSAKSANKGSIVNNFKIKDNFKEIFIGHTPTIMWDTTDPMQAMNIHNLDTGAGYKGKLTIMDVDTKEYFQSDQVDLLYPEQKGRNK